jgi:hypothetical protein
MKKEKFFLTKIEKYNCVQGTEEKFEMIKKRFTFNVCCNKK